MLNDLTMLSNTVYCKVKVKGRKKDVWRMLTDFKYINTWEADLRMFKEVHVVEEYNKVIHWDLLHEIDITYLLSENLNYTVLEIYVLNDLVNKNVLDYDIDYYISKTQKRLKCLVENGSLNKISHLT